MGWIAEQDIDFINKRICEQSQYLEKLLIRVYLKEIDNKRYYELRDSAISQLEYFEKLKEDYEDNKSR